MSATSGGRREFRSMPALFTGAALSTVLVVGALAMWAGLGPGLRAQFTVPQVLTLLLFLAVMVLIMMSVGLSSVVVDDEALHVRNALWSRHYPWREVLGVSLGDGDPWAYIVLTPTEEHPEGRTQMALAIQRSEGRRVEGRVEELRRLVAEHHTAARG